MVATAILALFFALPSAFGGSIPHTHNHDDAVRRALPSKWYHEDTHPAYQLFRRGPADDGQQYPDVGSPTWTAAYPTFTPDSKAMPDAWKQSLNAVVSAGKIPKIPQSSNHDGSNPVYPTGNDPNGQTVCSTTYKCRSPDTIWDAPDGYMGLSFDDGPQPASNTLYDFMASKQETATLFMIGVYILQNPKIFLRAFAQEHHDIACHTWTHPYMTTLSNEDVVAQLGWSMQIIHDSTGGRLPRYWRPPYGDSDTRVRAIAKEVFGLETVIWNQDTEDWSLTTGGTTPQKVNASMTQWLTGPKSPGLVILEHELSDQSVAAFISAYPVIKANGWNTGSLARLIMGAKGNQDDENVYQNAGGPTGPVNFGAVGANPSDPPTEPSGPSGGASDPNPSGSAPSGSSNGPKPSGSPGSAALSGGSQTTGSGAPKPTDNGAISFKASSWLCTALLALAGFVALA